MDEFVLKWREWVERLERETLEGLSWEEQERRAAELIRQGLEVKKGSNERVR